MELYSLTLLVALIAVGTAFVALLWTAVPRQLRGPESDRSAERLAKGAVTLGLLSAALSAGVHVATGHRPGTDDAMRLVEFLSEHPAYAAVAVVAFLVLARLASTR